MKKTIKHCYLFLLIILFSSCSKNKEEDDFYKETINESFKWFSMINAIDYNYDYEKEKVISSSLKTKKSRIQINRIKAGIKDIPEWEFVYQNYNNSYLSLGKCLIQIETIFTNNQEQLIFREVYYFDLFEDDLDKHPLPITSKIEILKNGELKTVKHQRIWKGDYNYIIEQINKK